MLHVNTIRAVNDHTRKFLLLGLVFGAMTLALHNSPARAQTANCPTIAFDDPVALKQIVEQARSAWGVQTTKLSNGALDYCKTVGNSAQLNPTCWQYQQSCGLGSMSLWTQNRSHFHLGFEDPRLGECVVNNGFGKMVNNECVGPNGLSGSSAGGWENAPRYAASHDGAAWYEFLLRDKANPAALRVFDLKTLAVGSTTAIQLWFKKVDGSTWGWSNLPPGNWALNANGIIAFWVSGAAGADSFTINQYQVVPR